MKWVLIILLFLSSCNIQKWCYDKYPPIEGYEIETFTDTIIRDSLIYVTIKPDTITQVDTVYIEYNVLNLPYRRLDTEFAWAETWVKDNQRYFNLYQKDTIVSKLIKDAIRNSTTTVIETRDFVREINILTWWQTFWIWVGRSLTVILLSILVLILTAGKQTVLTAAIIGIINKIINTIRKRDKNNEDK